MIVSGYDTLYKVLPGLSSQKNLGVYVVFKASAMKSPTDGIYATEWCTTLLKCVKYAGKNTFFYLLCIELYVLVLILTTCFVTHESLTCKHFSYGSVFVRILYIVILISQERCRTPRSSWIYVNRIYTFIPPCKDMTTKNGSLCISQVMWCNTLFCTRGS